MAWQDTTAWLCIKDFNYYYIHTLYRRCCSHINSSLPGKCSPRSQDRLQYSGVEGYFRREKSNTKYILVRIRRTWYMFSSHPIYYLRPSFLFLLVVTQIRGHIAGPSPPLTTTATAYYGTCLAFYREKESTLSSLVDSIVPTHAVIGCLLYTSPSPRDQRGSRMPSSA